MPVPKEVIIGGQPHRLAFLSGGRYTTGTGSPSGPLDTSQRPYSMIQLVNTDGANTCYVGSDASVSSANGIPLSPGAAMKIASNDYTERVRFHDVYIAGDGSHAIVVAYWGV
jgi:hypothetical protein